MLTLGIDTPWLWTDPLGEQSLTTLIHEVAHHLNAHHGRDFHKEMENLAGRAARLMLMQARHSCRQYAGLLPEESARMTGTGPALRSPAAAGWRQCWTSH